MMPMRAMTEKVMAVCFWAAEKLDPGANIGRY